MHIQAPIKPEGQTQEPKDTFMDTFLLGIFVYQIKNVKYKSVVPVQVLGTKYIIF